jgi:hypothetical protein
MEILLIVILALVIGTLNVVCFFVGAKVGQKVDKGEPIETPSFNPINAIREAQEKREAEREQNQYDTVLHNIEIYDGTGNGQKDVM